MKKLVLALPLLVLAILVAPVSVDLVSAQAPSAGIVPDTGLDANSLGEQGTITDTDSLVDIILGLVNWIAWFVALAAVLFGLYSGVLFITAAGDDEKITKAKDILLYAIVGIVVAILAFSIVAISKSLISAG